MSDALVHRGPDDQGRFHDPDVTLGFRRLSVIDLEAGQQPIRLEDDRAVIVLNGEIYNFRELRRDLERRQQFRSRGDVEVVLRLYAEEGIAALTRLNGMFALAIWDRARRTLYLARDRFGIKPLYLCRTGGQLAFASEVSALLAGGFPTSREVDPAELHHYLHQKYLSPGGSIFRGVRSLPPATVLEVREDGTERETRYWEPRAAADPSGALAIGELESILAAAVKRQLVADVPVGVFLSGGVDSGTVTALVRRVGSEPVRTFSIGFEGAGAVSETPVAQGVARRLGTEHHELVLDATTVARDLPTLLGGLDGPIGDATCIPTWYMSRLARTRVTVALSGEGADELFGGYARQRYDAWIDRLGPARFLAGRLATAAGLTSSRAWRRLSMPPGPARFFDWSRVFERELIEDLWAEGAPPREDDLLRLHAGLETRWKETVSSDPLNARLEADRIAFLPGDLLLKVDRMSMAHSLEVRVPYLDNEVADRVLSLHGRQKVGLTADKLPLRAVAAHLLPGLERHRKRGFDVPIGAWIRGPLREQVTDLLAASAVRRRRLFRADVVERLLREHLGGTADHGQRLWSLVALEGWWRHGVDRVAAR